MKQIAVIFFIVCSTSVFAQFSKGDKTLGGKLSFSIKYQVMNVNGNSTRETSLGVYPNFGIFVTKNLALGARLGYASSNRERRVASSFEDEYYHFSVGLYGDRYFQVSKKFFLSLLGGIGYHSTKDIPASSPPGKIDNSSADIKANLTPNLIFFPTPNWGLTGELGGAECSYILKSKSYQSNHDALTIDLGYSLKLGIFYYFRKTEKKSQSKK